MTGSQYRRLTCFLASFLKWQRTSVPLVVLLLPPSFNTTTTQPTKITPRKPHQGDRGNMMPTAHCLTVAPSRTPKQLAAARGVSELTLHSRLRPREKTTSTPNSHTNSTSLVPKAIHLRRQMGYVCAPTMNISAVYKQQGVVKEGFLPCGITRCGMLNELHHQ